LVWIKQAGGRVAYDALGHDVESLNVPAHATMIRRCAAWLLGEPDEVVARIL
jgi:type 1 glutamine amidotransferase